MTTLSARQTIFLVALFVMTSLAFIQLDSRRALDPVKDAMRGILAPVVTQIGSAGRGTTIAMEREIAAVKAERDQLAAENAQLRAAVREVEQLRMQAKLQQERATWKMLQARVQAPDPTNQQKFLTIDNGGRLDLRYLDRDAEPQPGELVLTTDSAALRTARVPGGLIVGRVGDAPPDAAKGDTQTVPVIPLVAFERLEVVTVVLTDEG